MKRFFKFLVSSIIIVTVAFGIFKLSNRYSLSVIDDSVEWSISLKGYEGARTFDYDEDGNLYIAFSDTIRVINKDGKDEVIIRENGFDILDILCYENRLFLATDNRIVEYNMKNNTYEERIVEIPNRGENSKINLLGKDRKIYFSIGSNTNSGVVSDEENEKDIATTNWKLTGENYGDKGTGAFSDFGFKTERGQEIEGEILGNASVIEFDLDTEELKIFSHGIRNIRGWDIDSNDELFAIIGGMEDKGVRAVKDDKDYIYKIEGDVWYGWPDYSGGDPITSPRFTDCNRIEFLIENHIDNTPPAPVYQHKDIQCLNGFAIDRGSVLFDKDAKIFADNKTKELYTLSSDGILTSMVKLAENSYIEEIKFYDENMYILDSGTGCLYKLESGVEGELFNLPKVVWVFFIVFLIVIFLCVIYKLNGRNSKSEI